MSSIEDLAAEQDRLEDLLDGLDGDAWGRPSGAPGWSVADVVLHLAQSEEAVVASCTGGDGASHWERGRSDLDELMDALVQAERAPGPVVFERWRTARRAALTALRTADPDQRVPWAATPLRPGVLAITRLAEHWAHGLDITGPLDLPFPDTDRLRAIAWLAHRTLPYAFALAGEEPVEVRCTLTGPAGDLWELGPAECANHVEGPAGEFCRIGARRLDPADATLRASGPGAAEALRLLRNYAA